MIWLQQEADSTSFNSNGKVGNTYRQSSDYSSTKYMDTGHKHKGSVLTWILPTEFECFPYAYLLPVEISPKQLSHFKETLRQVSKKICSSCI